MENYFSTMAVQLGINLWVLIAIIVWSFIWKMLALWKAARKSSPIWFVFLMLINTIGILEILYIFVISKISDAEEKESKEKKTVRKRKRK